MERSFPESWKGSGLLSSWWRPNSSFSDSILVAAVQNFMQLVSLLGIGKLIQVRTLLGYLLVSQRCPYPRTCAVVRRKQLNSGTQPCTFELPFRLSWTWGEKLISFVVLANIFPWSHWWKTRKDLCREKWKYMSVEWNNFVFSKKVLGIMTEVQW